MNYKFVNTVLKNFLYITYMRTKVESSDPKILSYIEIFENGSLIELRMGIYIEREFLPVNFSSSVSLISSYFY